jgi:16S rRNA processing protein RimM
VAKPQSPQQVPEKRVVAGKVTTVHGVRGWLKIHSYTAPEANIFDYQPWWMKFPEGWRRVEIDQFQQVSKGFIAHIKGLDDRDEARSYCQREIEVPTASFPSAAEDEFYWHELEGLRVINLEGLFLGTVSGLMETGANDVLIVKPASGSVDQIERLIPYIDQVIDSVSVAVGEIRVDWDPEFEKTGRESP